MMPCGFLNINKPVGMTSRDVVNRVQRLAGKIKAGHTGTLDPLASGVLVVCLGTATRLASRVQAMRKQYRATFLLGMESPTDDVDGPVTPRAGAPVPSDEQLRMAAASLTGEIEQRPPAFSACKLNGRRAYDLARAGREVHLQPRPVTVYRLEIDRYEYPRLDLTIECGSGTYVRALGRDLATRLGTAAVMSRLVRTAIGCFTIDDSVTFDQLGPENWPQYLLSPLHAVMELPRAALSREEIRQLQRGQTILRPDLVSAGTELAGMDPDGQIAAILIPRAKARWAAAWQASHAPAATNR